MRLRFHPVAATLLSGLVLAACSSTSGGGSTPTPSPGPADLLRQAKSAVDSAQTMHVHLATSGATGQLHSVDGSLKRPDQFKGTIAVNVVGSTVQVPVVSTGGKVYAKLPLTSGYSTVNPATYGVKDPGQLLDPSTGLSSLLPDTQHPKSDGQKRVNGEVVDQVSGQLPAKDLAAVLPISQQSGSVPVTYDIADSNKQLRQVVVTGNLAGKGDATYTLTLDQYGQPVSISAPG